MSGDGRGLTVTCNHEKLIVTRNQVGDYVREGRHNLLLRLEVYTLLELKVPNRTRQGEVAVDATEIDEAPCGGNSGLFACYSSAESIDMHGAETRLHFGACDRTRAA